MSNLGSLIFYLSLFSLSTLLMYYGHKRNNKIIIGLSLSIPILIGSLRYGVGTDYFNYVTIYNNLSSLSLANFLHDTSSQIEIGFFLLIKLSEFITGNSNFLFAASSVLTVLFFYLGLRRYDIKHPTLVYFLFLLIIFPITFNAVRQGVAMSICFYALSFVIERKPKAYIFWIIMASLFHTTSLFLLPIYFLNKVVRKYKKNTYIIFLSKLVVLSLIISFLLPYIFELLSSMPFFEKYDRYQTLSAEGNNYTFYLKFIIVGLILLFSKLVIPQNSKNVYFYFLAFAVFELIFTALGFSSEPIKRVALYFSFFSFILLTNFVDIFNDRSGKFVMYSLVILFGISYFYLAYFHLGQANVIPYQLILRADL